MMRVQFAWYCGRVMNCHAIPRGSIPGENGVKTELHVLRKGVPYLNDLAVGGM